MQVKMPTLNPRFERVNAWPTARMLPIFGHSLRLQRERDGHPFAREKLRVEQKIPLQIAQVFTHHTHALVEHLTLLNTQKRYKIFNYLFVERFNR